MTYDELIKHYQSKHLYFNKTVVMRKDRNVVEGLWIYCNPLLKESRLKVVEDSLPSGFSCTYFPNLSEIHIKANK